MGAITELTTTLRYLSDSVHGVPTTAMNASHGGRFWKQSPLRVVVFTALGGAVLAMF